MFGFGEFEDRSNDIPSVLNSLDMAKFHITQSKQIPDELKESILNYTSEDAGYGGFLLGGDEDLAEEIDAIQSYIRGDFKKREDGRYVWKSLLLGKDQSPKDFIVEHYPLSSSEVIT